ncbi:MAG: hypothetical protein OXG19_09705 [Chloroflexi bacterium]|nr:hypothetical protein [Chloroflexota bacterium]
MPDAPAIEVIGPVRWWTARAGEDGAVGAWVAFSPDLRVNASGRSERELNRDMDDAAREVFYDLAESGELEDTCKELNLEIREVVGEPPTGRLIIVPTLTITRKTREEVAAGAAAAGD